MTAAASHRAKSDRSCLLLPSSIRACLFDLDGVLTDTASVHFRAWKEMFDAFLREREPRRGESFAPFQLRDYHEFVDGRERFDGVRRFLASRGVSLPAGSKSDSPDAETIGGLGNRKNELLHELIRRCGVEPYEGSLRLVDAVRRAGLGRAVVSASANCRAVLEAAGIEGLFDVRVDAVTAEQEHLGSKPAPDMFLAAARLLGVTPRAAAVFEDALVGVRAGRAGGFGLVVGVDRVGHAAALREHGADIVVSDLAELLATP